MTGTRRTSAKSTKATGQHIPAPPAAAPQAEAQETAAAAPAAAAPAFAFEPAGVAPVAPAAPADETNGWGQAAQAALAGGDDITWVEEDTALGKRVAVTKLGDSVTTHEEIVPYGTSPDKIAAVKARLSRKVLPVA